MASERNTFDDFSEDKNETPYTALPDSPVAITDKAMALPDKETLEFVIKMFEENQTIADEKQKEKHLCESFMQAVVICLESKEATNLNISVGLPSAANNVMSTFPEIFNDSRLKAVSGAQLFLFAVATTAHLMVERFGSEASEKIKNLIRFSAIFSNGFSFAFGLGCKIAANIWASRTEIPVNAEIGGVLGTILGTATFLGIFEYYGQTQQPGTTVRKASDAIFFGLNVGTLFSQANRVYNYTPVEEPAPSTLTRAILGWTPVVLSGSALILHFLFARNGENTMRIRLSPINNALNILGTTLESIVAGDKITTTLLGVQIFSVGGSHFLLKHCAKPSKKEEQTPLITQDDTQIPQRKLNK